MKRCTLILSDAGPINSLWVADRLPLLLALDMRIVLVDAVYDELTSDPSFLKDAEVKAFIDGNMPPFIIERTDIGEAEREKRRLGQKLKKNAGELAMIDFVSDEGGLETYLKTDEPVAILFADAGLRGLQQATEPPPDLDRWFAARAGNRRGHLLGGCGDQRDAPSHQARPEARGRKAVHRSSAWDR